jgi:ketosteroid isomerase-like protein
MTRTAISATTFKIVGTDAALPLREGVMSDIRSTLEALCEAFNAHDLDAIMAHFADDCVLEMPRGPDPWGARFEGKTAVREGLAGRFRGLPDVHYGDATHFVDGDTGISKWTLTGTTPRGPPARGEGLRLLYLPRRAGGAEGCLLEDRRVDDER